MSRNDFVVDASEVKRFVSNLVAVDSSGNKRQFNTVHVVDGSGNKKQILPNDLVRGIAESLTFEETTALIKTLVLSASEGITLSEQFGKFVDSRTTSKGFSESIVLTESTSLTIAKTITASDTLNLSERLGKFVEVTATEPDPPSNLTATEITCSDTVGDVELTLDDNSDNEDEWRVYKDGMLFDIRQSDTTGSTGQITITASDPVTPGESADFTVSAANDQGESSQTAPDAVNFRDEPNTPNNVEATWNATACSVTVTWDEVSNACEYEVYRDGTSLGTTTNTSFPDSSASENTSYEYEVEAINDHGTGNRGSDLITTGNCDGPG